MKKNFLLSLLGLIMIYAFSQNANAAPISVSTCGETLTTAGGEYVLANNLNCSGAGDFNGVTIAASNVTFHLAGRTISSDVCDLTRNISGIFVVGGLTNVKIDGGTVIGFNDGIVLSSSNSRVEGMTVSNACSFGILVGGENNRVETSRVSASGDGIALSPATGARITSNDVSGNVRGGVMLSAGASGNFIEKNISNNNGTNGDEGYGVVIFDGSYNIVRNNAANNNDIGIRISSPNNAVNNNTVSGNSQYGIWISSDGEPSSVRRNSVFGNGLFDMIDDLALCGTNVWRNNRFITDLAGGIPDGGPGSGCIQ